VLAGMIVLAVTLTQRECWLCGSFILFVKKTLIKAVYSLPASKVLRLDYWCKCLWYLQTTRYTESIARDSIWTIWSNMVYSK